MSPDERADAITAAILCYAESRGGDADLLTLRIALGRLRLNATDYDAAIADAKICRAELKPHWAVEAARLTATTNRSEPCK